MKKTYRLENLECANCAAKMERNIKELDGVNDCSVSFIAQKLTLDAQDDQFEKILKKAAKICRKIEPDCEVII